MNTTTESNLTDVLGVHLLYFNMTGLERIPQFNLDDHNYHIHLSFVGAIGDKKLKRDFDFVLSRRKPNYHKYFSIAKNLAEFCTPRNFSTNFVFLDEPTLVVTYYDEIIAIKQTNQDKFLMLKSTTDLCYIKDEKSVIEYIKSKQNESAIYWLKKLNLRKPRKTSYNFI